MEAFYGVVDLDSEVREGRREEERVDGDHLGVEGFVDLSNVPNTSISSGGGQAPMSAPPPSGKKALRHMTDEELMDLGIKPPTMDYVSYFAKISDVFATHLDVTKSRKLCLQGLRRGTQQYIDASKRFKLGAIEQCLNVLKTSKKLPASYVQAIKQHNERSQHFFDITHYYKDLTFFGNCMALHRDRIGIARGSGEFTPLVQIIILLGCTVFSWKEAMRGHFAAIGLASGGKSHMLKTLMKFFPAGFVRNATYQTSKSLAVGGEVQCFIDLIDEFAAEDLGMGNDNSKDGRNEAIAKQQMVDPRVSVQSIVTEEGQRTQREYASFMNTVKMGGYNGTVTDEQNALAARFFKVDVSKTKPGRNDTVVNRVLETSDAEKNEVSEAVCEQEVMTNYYIMVLDFMIFCGAINDVNMNAFKMYARRVVESMHDRGYEVEDAKKINHMIMLARSLTLRHAIEVAFFSDLTYDLRRNEDGSYKRFDEIAVQLFMLAENYLVVTREISVYAITLCQTTWGAQLESAAIESARNATILHSLELFDEECYTSEVALDSARSEIARLQRRKAQESTREIAKAKRKMEKSRYNGRGKVSFSENVPISDEIAAKLAEEMERIKLGDRQRSEASDSAGYAAETEDSRSSALHEDAVLNADMDGVRAAGEEKEAFATDTVEEVHKFRFETRYEKTKNERLVKNIVANYVEITTDTNMGVEAAAAILAAHSKGVVMSVRHLASTLRDLARQRVKAPSLRLDPATGKVAPSGRRALFPVVRIVPNSSAFDARQPPPRGMRVFILTNAMLNQRSVEDALYESICELGFRYAVPGRVVTALPKHMARSDGKKSQDIDMKTSSILRVVDIQVRDEQWIHSRVDFVSQRIVEAFAQSTSEESSILRQYRPSMTDGSSSFIVGVEPEFTACQQHELETGTPKELSCFGTSLILNMAIAKTIRRHPAMSTRKQVDYVESTEREFITARRKRALSKIAERQAATEKHYASTSDAIPQAEARWSAQLIMGMARLNPRAALNMLEQRGTAERSEDGRAKLRRVDNALRLHARAVELAAEEGEASTSINTLSGNVFSAIVDDVDNDLIGTNAVRNDEPEYSGNADFGDVSSASAQDADLDFDDKADDGVRVQDLLSHISGQLRKSVSIPRSALTRSSIAPIDMSVCGDEESARRLDAMTLEAEAQDAFMALDAKTQEEIDGAADEHNGLTVYTDEDAADADGFRPSERIIGEFVEQDASQEASDFSLYDHVQQSSASAQMPPGLRMASQISSFQRKIDQAAAQHTGGAPVPEAQAYPPSPTTQFMPRNLRDRYLEIKRSNND